MNELRELRITRVGAQGDGVADDNGAAIFVPFALTGERVAVDVSGERARLLEVLEPSEARVKPVCRHFGVCGGCSVQHMAPDSYRAWKRESVVAAFRTRGLDVEVAPLIAPGGKRRRAVFTVERTESGLVVGFHEAASHALVSIEECPVLDPKIVAALSGAHRSSRPADFKARRSATDGIADERRSRRADRRDRAPADV